MDNLGQQGVFSVVPPAQLEQQLQQADAAHAAAQDAARDGHPPQELLTYIKAQFEVFRNHRNTASGWSDRLLASMRAFNGQYSATKLAEIRKWGGSEIYARIIGQKCRAASSLLRDIYLGQDRPWAVRPPQNIDVPPEIQSQIDQLVQQEEQMLSQQTKQPPNAQEADKRRRDLMEQAEDAAKVKAAEQARESEERIEDILREGGFYHALAEFLVDLPVFPFACIKGPVVKVIPKVTWPKGGGRPTVEHLPTLTWCRVSPFDVWWTPGVADIENADVIEKLSITRAELNDLLDLPGYNTEEIRAVLDEYGRGGLYDNWDSTDSERAALESRENPAWNRSALISMMEFNGNVQGRLLQDYGLAVEDELRDYGVQVWCIGKHVIKAHLSPSPRQRHPYFITSFEKVPGTPVGNGLTDLLSDMQEAANSTLRSLLNNMSIASGPQVVINDDRVSPSENTEDMYPWKRWHSRSDPSSNNSQVPVSFFMPTSNAQQLIAVYEKFVGIADDVSAIPKYVGGQGGGGAGRTASGLAMLMGNASKILQSVSANIDRDVLEPALMQLSDLILLTDKTGLLTGEERVTVMGVNVAIQRETLRQRQTEFLQATNNPTDMKIMGLKGRAAVLRAVSRDIGITGEELVPDADQLDKMQQAEKKGSIDAAIDQRVEEGIQKGVQAGVTRIATELTAGTLAARAHLPEGNPTHIGTLPTQEGPTTNDPAMDLGSDMSQRAAFSQGTQRPTQIAGGGMGPQLATTAAAKGPGAMPIAPGVG